MAPQAGRESWNALLEDISSTARLPVLDEGTLPSIPVADDRIIDQVRMLERQIGELTGQLERISRSLAESDALIDGLRLEQSRLEGELQQARFVGEDLDDMRRKAEARAETAEVMARTTGERAAELEAHLRAAEDQIHQLESELRLRSPRAAAPVVESLVEPPPALQPVEPATQPQIALASQDGIARYFVMTKGDAEVVHMLGRRTTIGRGSDNDLRIDTRYISRNHAVITAGPAQTVLEDLHSTNGVLVNGRRVTRAVLRDGDIVHIGRTQFRYVQRQRDRG